MRRPYRTLDPPPERHQRRGRREPDSSDSPSGEPGAVHDLLSPEVILPATATRLSSYPGTAFPPAPATGLPHESRLGCGSRANAPLAREETGLTQLRGRIALRQGILVAGVPPSRLATTESADESFMHEPPSRARGEASSIVQTQTPSRPRYSAAIRYAAHASAIS